MKQKQTNLQKNRHLFDRWAKSYDNAVFQFWLRKFHAPAAAELQLNPKTKVLDLSCGTGELLKSLLGKAELYGVDISEGMLKIAAQKLGQKVKLLKADVHELPFEDNFFDYVITTEAFHHYYGQPSALKEMVRVTKKTGKVIIVDINFFLKPVHWLFQKLEPGCVKVNSKKEMKILFEEAGLKNIRQRRNFLFAVMTTGEKQEITSKTEV